MDVFFTLFLRSSVNIVLGNLLNLLVFIISYWPRDHLSKPNSLALSFYDNNIKIIYLNFSGGGVVL